MKAKFTIVFVVAHLIGGGLPAATIDFDDVAGSFVDITTRYAPLGVTLNAIPNPFPLTGPFSAPTTLPSILGGVTTWDQGFRSASSFPHVAVAAATLENGSPGNAGILVSFAFDVSHVSLVGNDLGFGGGFDDESVTLTAYDEAGNQIGQTFSQFNFSGLYDQTPAAIDLPGMRYVAFNYTDSLYGFYAIDDLQFTPVPEPSTVSLLGLIALVWIMNKKEQHGIRIQSPPKIQ